MKKHSLLFNFLLFAFVVFSQYSQEFIDQSTVKDIDGNVYQTIRIGDQTWMAENLKTTHYRDGALIPNVPEQGAWSRLKTGALCWYENDPLSYKDVYGALYNSYAVADIRKLCPPGWHVPTIDEWRKLEKYLGGGDVAGGKMKDNASRLWKALDPEANNSSGFAAVPAGGRGRMGSFGEGGYYVTWWTSTADGADFAWHWGLHPDQAATRSNPGHKASGFSVRCVKDE
ncbi:MAG: fibrobacter succinogenes major paralogous domain-containing protein [Chrysiogenales bacterium]